MIFMAIGVAPFSDWKRMMDVLPIIHKIAKYQIGRGPLLRGITDLMLMERVD